MYISREKKYRSIIIVHDYTVFDQVIWENPYINDKTSEDENPYFTLSQWTYLHKVCKLIYTSYLRVFSLKISFSIYVSVKTIDDGLTRVIFYMVKCRYVPSRKGEFQTMVRLIKTVNYEDDSTHYKGIEILDKI